MTIKDIKVMVNGTFLQPFISYTTKTHTSFALNTESGYDRRPNQCSLGAIGNSIVGIVGGGMDMQRCSETD
jgi:hypothetical protein